MAGRQAAEPQPGAAAMPATTDFTKMLPGFDFLQGLMKNAGAGLPGMSQWIAPTLDPDELDKRIGELRTVQFWLEQNARMLAATVQTLEVQRLTLSTLKTMNLPLADISESLRIKLPNPPAPPPAPVAPNAPTPAPEPVATAPAPAAAAAVVDPMAWWGSLTQQFAELAAQAMKDVRADAAAAKPAAAAEPGAAKTAARKIAKKAAKKAAKTAAKRAAKTAARPAPRRASS
jgi:hypothetical protein